MWSAFAPETFTPQYGPLPGLEVIRHRGRCILVHPDTGAWAVAGEAEVAGLLHPRALPRDVAREAYRLGLAHRNGARTVAAPFPPDQPMRLFELNLSPACNLRCTYCLVDSAPVQGAPRITPAVCDAFVHRVLDYCAERSLTSAAVDFVGGEPFLQFPAMRYTMELFARLKPPSLSLQFRIQTNFTAMKPSHLEFLTGHDAHLGLSLDGDQATHDRHRRFWASGQGSFTTVMANLRRARRAGFRVHAAYSVVTADEVERLPDRARFMLAHDLRYLALDPVRPTGRARLNLDLVPDPERYARRLLDTFEEVFLPHFRATGVMPSEQHLSVALAHLLEPTRRHMCFMAPCGAGWLISVTMPDGRVYPCNEHPWPGQFHLGSVFSDSFQSMIDSPPARALRRRTPARIAGCGRCLYRGWCQSPCSHGALVTHGRLLAPSMYCGLMRNLYRECLLALVDGRFPPEAVHAQAREALACA